MGFSVTLTGRDEGAMFEFRAGVFLGVLREEGGECCRYGKDLGEYMMALTAFAP